MWGFGRWLLESKERFGVVGRLYCGTASSHDEPVYFSTIAAGSLAPTDSLDHQQRRDMPRPIFLMSTALGVLPYALTIKLGLVFSFYLPHNPP